MDGGRQDFNGRAWPGCQSCLLWTTSAKRGYGLRLQLWSGPHVLGKHCLFRKATGINGPYNKGHTPKLQLISYQNGLRSDTNRIQNIDESQKTTERTCLHNRSQLHA